MIEQKYFLILSKFLYVSLLWIALSFLESQGTQNYQGNSSSLYSVIEAASLTELINPS